MESIYEAVPHLWNERAGRLCVFGAASAIVVVDQSREHVDWANRLVERVRANEQSVLRITSILAVLRICVLVVRALAVSEELDSAGVGSLKMRTPHGITVRRQNLLQRKVTSRPFRQQGRP